MRKKIIFLLLIFCFGISFVNSNAQVKVSLKLDESAEAGFNKFLFCDKDYNCGLNQNEKSKTSKIDGLEIIIKVSRTGKNFYLLLDTNRNNKLTDEKKVLLGNGSKVKVRIKRKDSFGKSLFLPFEISHEIHEKSGIIIDKFRIIQMYAVVGTVNYKNCSIAISLSDMNYDGKFSLTDAERGTNLKVDRNKDGKFWGKEEYNKTSEIIEVCGQNYLISSLNDTKLTLMPTDLQLAKIGSVVPKFSFTLQNGNVKSSENLRGKPYILDFWASWCVPCVENLPQVNQLKKEYQNWLSVFSVNVDVLSRKNMAEKIINENGLFDFSTVRSLGNDDPLWKTFGGANLNRLAIPLYVLIDKNGIVRYADNGGERLAELKSNIEKLSLNQ